MLEINRSQTPEVRSAIERLRSRMNVGRLIVQYRLRRGLTQAQMAQQAGTKQSRISEIETLSGNVRFDTLDKIAMVLGLEITLQERPKPFAGMMVYDSPLRGIANGRGVFLPGDPLQMGEWQIMETGIGTPLISFDANTSDVRTALAYNRVTATPATTQPRTN